MYVVVLGPLGPMIEPTGSDHLNIQGRVRNVARVTQTLCCASCWGDICRLVNPWHKTLYGTCVCLEIVMTGVCTVGMRTVKNGDLRETET
jgi:hypothetical protein